jgi:hypothetical protein
MDPNSPLDRAIMQKKIEMGWEPTPGCYWAVVAYSLPPKGGRLWASARADSAQEALEKVLETISEEVFGMDIVLVLLDEVVTEADIPEWRKQRAAWLASQKEKRWPT